MKLRLRPHHAPRFSTLQPAGDPDATTLRVPGFRQTRSYTCGFATSLMVMHYFGAEIGASELLRRLGTGPDGTRQSAIVRELRAAGLRANVRYDVDFSRLCRAIDRNKLIVGYLHDAEHWLVIYGYGRQPDRVFVADPQPEEGCEHGWEAYGARLKGFGIICSHPRNSTTIHQAPLDLGQAPAPPPPTRPPPPVAELRCEVRYFPQLDAAAEPAQLALPFA